VELIFLGCIGQGVLEVREEFVPFGVSTCKEVWCSLLFAFT